MEQKELKPKLRFKGFEEKWRMRKLGEMGDIISGLTYSPKDISPGGVLVLRSSNIQDGQLSFRDNVYVNVSEGKFNPVIRDDILICVRNGSKNLIGKNAIINSKVAGVAFGAFMAVYRSEYNKFIFQLFGSNRYYREVHKNLGATINSINASDLKKFKFAIPSTEEQQKIASFLSAVDTYIDNLKQQKEALEKYKKGMMQKIFSQQIRFKDAAGKEFPEWEERELDQIFSSLKGMGLAKEDILEDGENYCILYGELYTKYKEVIDEIKSKTNRNVGIKSQIGDLLIPCSTTTTAIDLANVLALNKENILLGGDITILRSKLKINNIFFAYYLTNYKKTSIAKYGQGSTIVHLYYNHFKKILIDLPNFEEQEKIAKNFSTQDKFIEVKQQQIEKFENWKKGLLQQLFI